MDLNRDSFISEEIINYLQSSFQNIYSDSNIIKNYIRYKDLLLKQETSKTSKTAKITNDIYTFTSEDEEELESLNRYFYGNSDGSSSGNGNNIAYTYLSTIQTIKELIDKSDNSIKDVVVNLTSLLSTSNMSDDAYKRYLNELIIPGILGTSEITADKAEITVKLNKDIENQFSAANKNAYIAKVTDEKLMMMTNEQIIKDKKLTDEAILQEKLEGKLVLDNRMKQAKQKEAQLLKDKNKLAFNSEKKALFKQKKKDINSDIKLKIQKINEIIKNEIYLGSIKKLLKGRVKSEHERKNIFRNEEPQIKAKNDDNDDNDNDNDNDDNDDNDDDEKVYKATKTEEERNKLDEVIRTLKTPETSETSQKDNSTILKDAFTRLKQNVVKGGGFKDSEIPIILYEINRTTTQTSKLSYNEKTEKLLNLYLRLYTSYINPLKEKLADSANDDKLDNLQEDIILLYNNFKKEYDEFIKQNKEILESEKKIITEQKNLLKINENSIEQSILDLFEQYENLAIKLKDTEKNLTLKSIKQGGASKKLYLVDIKKTLQEYQDRITDKDDKSKLLIEIKSLKDKIGKKEATLYNGDYFNTLINDLDTKIKDANTAAGPAAAPAGAPEAADAAGVAKEKEAKSAMPYIIKLLEDIAKINEMEKKVLILISELSELSAEQTENQNAIKRNIEEIQIQLNIELTTAYNQLKTVKQYLPADNKINENIEILNTFNTELKEIYDKFNEIKKLVDSETQDKSKKEIYEKFKEINDLFKKLKTLKYLNKYKYYLDTIKNLLDEVKTILDNLAKNDDNDASNDNDDMKKQLQEEITDLQEKLDKYKSENARNISELNKVTVNLDKLNEEKDTIEQNIAGLPEALGRGRDQSLIARENKKQEQNNIQKLEATKEELEAQIKLNKNIIETTDKEIKGKQKKLDKINSSKEKEIKQKKIAADLESQREFIRNITNKLKEYLALVDYLNKIIASIRIIKKTLNEFIFSKLNSQMKTNFKFIQKRYIKSLIDFYNFKLISDYIIKLNNIEKLKPQEKKDEKLTDNIESRYDKIKEEYKKTFYKELEDIIKFNNYEEIADIVIKFLNNLVKILDKDEDIIEDRIDDYQVYLIINLIIILAELKNKEKIKVLFKIYFNLIGDNNDISKKLNSIDQMDLKSTDIGTAGGGYSNIIPQDIKENEKILPTEKINYKLLNVLKETIYESFIQMRPTTDGITKKKLNTLIPVCDIEKYFLQQHEVPSIDNYINVNLQTKVHIDLPEAKLRNAIIKIISTSDIYKFLKNDVRYIHYINNDLKKNLIKYFNENISELTLEYIVNNLIVKKEDYSLFVFTLYYIIIKLINEKQIKINDILLQKDIIYILYIIIYDYNALIHYLDTEIEIEIEIEIFITTYNDYKLLIVNIDKLFTTLRNNFKSTSDIYIILQYLIKISNYMLIDIHNRVDKYIYNKLNVTKLTDIDNFDISVLYFFLEENADSDFNNSRLYFENYENQKIDIKNEAIRVYIINMNNYVKENEISLNIYFNNQNIVTYFKVITNINSDTFILLSLNKYNNLFKNDINLVTAFLMNVYIIINKDMSISTDFRKDL
uniref:Uncharacterized protein n=1 Tax=viral metagenome TaxID=1070528 RepID=A0A6C0EN09_9ZZZZ